MSSRENIVEKTKSILIFLLVLCLFLNSYLIVSKSFDKNFIKKASPINEEKDFSDFVKPSKFEIKNNNGESVFIYKLNEEMYNYLYKYLIDYVSLDHEIKKIEKDFLNEKPIITFFYDSFLPANVVLNNKKVKLIKNKLVNSISFVFDKDVYLLINCKDASYKINIEKKDFVSYPSIDLSYFKSEIKNIFESTSIRYKSFNKDENFSLLPKLIYRGYYSPQYYEFKPEYNYKELHIINKLLSNFFGAKSSFIKEAMTASSDKIYMSAYGDEILKLSPDGSLEYKTKIYDENSISTLEYDLEKLINFEEKIFSFDKDIYLSKITEENKEDYSFRTFYFTKKVLDKDIISQNKYYGIVFKVRSGKVIEYFRYLPKPLKIENYNQKGKIYRENTMLDILLQDEILKKIKKEYISKNPKATFPNERNQIKKTILSFIKDVEIVYSEFDENYLSPSYLVETDDSKFLIDFYTERGMFNELE